MMDLFQVVNILLDSVSTVLLIYSAKQPIMNLNEGTDGALLLGLSLLNTKVKISNSNKTALHFYF